MLHYLCTDKALNPRPFFQKKLFCYFLCKITCSLTKFATHWTSFFLLIKLNPSALFVWETAHRFVKDKQYEWNQANWNNTNPSNHVTSCTQIACEHFIAAHNICIIGFWNLAGLFFSLKKIRSNEFWILRLWLEMVGRSYITLSLHNLWPNH